ncbi:hypothetical protein [Pseudodonghicola flavimaris]|uniref:LysE family translocator n=1 Tax=Pseudodonghicola flavimaris TaxID=3050036 RepID=A0ABT7EYS2_9RHOB|nr:hypothetical protein [Pseudodonghicola flavimaris]MDK3017414.1 hypothetical protein [Pseudodonghicola flavimaris]
MALCCSGPARAQFFLHRSPIIAVAACIEPLLVLTGAGLTRGLRRRPGIVLRLQRGLGAVLIGLGLRLVRVALSRRAPQNPH